MPGTYNITLYTGDTYFGPLITIPDYSGRGGPSTLDSSVEVKAEVRRPKPPYALLFALDPEIVDAAERKVRLMLSAEVSSAIEVKSAIWDLQVRQGEWVKTPLAGIVTVSKEVTKP